ncbi:MAG TPA: hypothetical protein VGV61_00030, partial [Thermoanaerobaculia bacterium]|nr:hypothetical protein [Thermoanaerobaculia bacterium]
TVKVGEGASTRVEVPIRRPGEIQVQTKIGTPQGRVVLDGHDYGAQIVRRMLQPGSHRLRIDPTAPGSPSIDEQVDIESGKRLVVTFDLTSGRLLKRTIDQS